MDTQLTARMLIELRKATGFSQIRLSRNTNVSRHRITMFECGYGDLTQEEVNCLVRFLGRQPAKKGGLS